MGKKQKAAKKAAAKTNRDQQQSFKSRDLQTIKEVNEALESKDLHQLRKLSCVLGLVNHGLRERCWGLLAGADSTPVTDHQYEQYAAAAHRDRHVVKVDVDRSLFNFLDGCSEEELLRKREQLQRLLNATIGRYCTFADEQPAGPAEAHPVSAWDTSTGGGSTGSHTTAGHPGPGRSSGGGDSTGSGVRQRRRTGGMSCLGGGSRRATLSPQGSDGEESPEATKRWRSSFGCLGGTATGVKAQRTASVAADSAASSSLGAQVSVASTLDTTTSAAVGSTQTHDGGVLLPPEVPAEEGADGTGAAVHDLTQAQAGGRCVAGRDSCTAGGVDVQGASDRLMPSQPAESVTPAAGGKVLTLHTGCAQGGKPCIAGSARDISQQGTAWQPYTPLGPGVPSVSGICVGQQLGECTLLQPGQQDTQPPTDEATVQTPATPAGEEQGQGQGQGTGAQSGQQTGAPEATEPQPAAPPQSTAAPQPALRQVLSQQVYYYQGLHDIASVLLLVCGSERAAFPILCRLVVGQLRDATHKALTPVMEVLNLLYPLVSLCDPELARHLRSNDLPPFFALSWLITWFAHDVHDVRVAARLFDAFLASHPLLPLYAGVAAMLGNKDHLLQCDEMPELHTALVNLKITHYSSADIQASATSPAHVLSPTASNRSLASPRSADGGGSTLSSPRHPSHASGRVVGGHTMHWPMAAIDDLLAAALKLYKAHPPAKLVKVGKVWLTSSVGPSASLVDDLWVVPAVPEHAHKAGLGNAKSRQSGGGVAGLWRLWRQFTSRGRVDPRGGGTSSGGAAGVGRGAGSGGSDGQGGTGVVRGPSLIGALSVTSVLGVYLVASIMYKLHGQQQGSAVGM